MTCEIIDGFLEPNDLFTLNTTLILSSQTPLFLQRGVSYSDTSDGIYFTHTFFEEIPRSEHCYLFDKILEKLEVTKLYRIKLNVYPQNLRRKKHGWHVDSDFPHKGCVISLNSNNGGTIVRDKPFNKFVKSEAGRAVIFDAGKEHRSQCCSDKYYRANIIINYE